MKVMVRYLCSLLLLSMLSSTSAWSFNFKLFGESVKSGISAAKTFTENIGATVVTTTVNTYQIVNDVISSDNFIVNIAGDVADVLSGDLLDDLLPPELSMDDLPDGFQQTVADGLTLVRNIEEGVTEFVNEVKSTAENVIDEVENLASGVADFTENAADALINCASSYPLDCFPGIVAMKSLHDNVQDVIDAGFDDLRNVIKDATEIENLSNLVNIDSLCAVKETVNLDIAAMQNVVDLVLGEYLQDTTIPTSIDVCKPDFAALIDNNELQQYIDVTTNALMLAASDFTSDLTAALEESLSRRRLLEAEELWPDFYFAVGVKFDLPTASSPVYTVAVEIHQPLLTPEKRKIDVFVEVAPLGTPNAKPQPYLDFRTGYSDSYHSFGMDLGVSIVAPTPDSFALSASVGVSTSVEYATGASSQSASTSASLSLSLESTDPSEAVYVPAVEMYVMHLYMHSFTMPSLDVSSRRRVTENIFNAARGEVNAATMSEPKPNLRGTLQNFLWSTRNLQTNEFELELKYRVGDEIAQCDTTGPVYLSFPSIPSFPVTVLDFSSVGTDHTMSLTLPEEPTSLKMHMTGTNGFCVESVQVNGLLLSPERIWINDDDGTAAPNGYTYQNFMEHTWSWTSSLEPFELEFRYKVGNVIPQCVSSEPIYLSFPSIPSFPSTLLDFSTLSSYRVVRVALPVEPYNLKVHLEGVDGACMEDMHVNGQLLSPLFVWINDDDGYATPEGYAAPSFLEHTWTWTPAQGSFQVELRYKVGDQYTYCKSADSAYVSFPSVPSFGGALLDFSTLGSEHVIILNLADEPTDMKINLIGVDGFCVEQVQLNGKVLSPGMVWINDDDGGELPDGYTAQAFSEHIWSWTTHTFEVELRYTVGDQSSYCTSNDPVYVSFPSVPSFGSTLLDFSSLGTEHVVTLLLPELPTDMKIYLDGVDGFCVEQVQLNGKQLWPDMIWINDDYGENVPAGYTAPALLENTWHIYELELKYRVGDEIAQCDTTGPVYLSFPSIPSFPVTVLDFSSVGTDHTMSLILPEEPTSLKLHMTGTNGFCVESVQVNDLSLSPERIWINDDDGTAAPNGYTYQNFMEHTWSWTSSLEPFELEFRYKVGTVIPQCVSSEPIYLSFPSIPSVVRTLLDFSVLGAYHVLQLTLPVEPYNLKIYMEGVDGACLEELKVNGQLLFPRNIWINDDDGSSAPDGYNFLNVLEHTWDSLCAAGYYKIDGKCTHPQHDGYQALEEFVTSDIGPAEYAMKFGRSSEIAMGMQYTHMQHTLIIRSEVNPEECLGVDDITSHVNIVACDETPQQLWGIAPKTGQLVSLFNGYCPNGYDSDGYLTIGNCPDGILMSWKVDADKYFIESVTGKYMKKSSSGKVSLVELGDGPTKMYWQTIPFAIKSQRLTGNNGWFQQCLSVNPSNVIATTQDPKLILATMQQCVDSYTQKFYMTSDGQIRFYYNGVEFCMYYYYSGSGYPHVTFSLCGHRTKHSFYKTAAGKLTTTAELGLPEPSCLDSDASMSGPVTFRPCSITPNGYNDQYFLFMRPPAQIRTRANVVGPNNGNPLCLVKSTQSRLTMAPCVDQEDYKYFFTEYSQLRCSVYPDKCPTYLPAENLFAYRECNPDDKMQKFLYNAELSQFTIAGIPDHCLTYDIMAHKSYNLILSKCEHNYIYQQFVIG